MRQNILGDMSQQVTYAPSDIPRHINILNPRDCCGCGGCAAICPSVCIQMRPDSEGFLSPLVDTAHCADCGLCLETCPWQTDREIDKRIFPPQVYAAWHLDQEIRRQSSSGGVFTALAEDILSRGGAVVGAAFDENLVVRHILVEDVCSLGRLRGSKYVQSEIPSELYSKIHALLNQGRYLLFSGTPCQVAGLRNFLGQDYKTLFCCDLICHGVPSPGWFKKYLRSLSQGTLSITQLSFRDKKAGWKHFYLKKTWSDGSSTFESPHSDPFTASFYRDYCLRASCYICKFSTTVRQSDITLADYWGVATKYPQYDREDRGTSLLLINTEKGQRWLNLCKATLFVGSGDLQHATNGNKRLLRPVSRPPERETFFQDMLTASVEELRFQYQLHLPPKRPLWLRGFGFLMRQLKKICVPL